MIQKIQWAAQNSFNQKEKIAKYLKIAKEDGAECLVGGDIYHSSVNPDGFYIEPTIYKGHNKMRIFQEEIFGPVLSVTTFKDEKEAIEIANDTIYGLGAGVGQEMHTKFIEYQELFKLEEFGKLLSCLSSSCPLLVDIRNLELEERLI